MMTEVECPLIVSTLGAPQEPIAAVAAMAQKAGAHGLELRVADGEQIALGASAADLARTKAECEDHNQPVITIASYLKAAGLDPRDADRVRRAAGTPDDPFMTEAREYCRIGLALGASRLRVFPGGPVNACPSNEVPVPDVPIDILDDIAAQRLSKLAPLAADHGLHVALETHDSHPRGQDVARILRRLEGCDGYPVVAIWDVLHPWRVGEDFADTWRELAPFLSPLDVGYVQIKDAASPTDRTPRPVGQGAIDLTGWWHVLRAGGYDGPVALEWERAWHPEIPPLSEVLPPTAHWLATRRLAENSH